MPVETTNAMSALGLSRTFWGVLALVAASTGCPSPPSPSPNPETSRPPRDRASECLPPFPMSFAQSWYVIADLDQGKSCTAFIEQDDCVLGIFRDCTVSVVREWQGEAKTLSDGTRAIDLWAFNPIDGNIPGSPKCCSGSLSEWDQPTTWAQLACQRDDCDNKENDTGHVGFYVEKKEPSPEAFGEAGTPIAVVSADNGWSASSLSAMAAVPSKDELWVLVNAPRNADQSKDGLYVVALSSGSVSAKVLAFQDGRDLAVSAAGDFAVIADGNTFFRVNTTSRQIEGATIDVGPTLAVAITDQDVLVAFESAGGTTLTARDPSDLSSERRNVEVTGRARGMVENGSGTIALTFSDRGTVSTVDGTFTETEHTPATALDASRPIWVSATQVGYTGRCAEGAPAKHCYFEYDVTAGPLAKPRRLGVPDVDELLSPVLEDSDTILLVSMNGWVARLERAPWRTHLQSRIELPEGLGTAALHESTLYAAAGARGQVHPVVVP